MMFSLDQVYKIPSWFNISNLSAGLLFSQQKKAYELEKQLRQVNGMNHAILERNQEITGCNKKLEETIERLQKQNKQLVGICETLLLLKVKCSHIQDLKKNKKENNALNQS